MVVDYLIRLFKGRGINEIDEHCYSQKVHFTSSNESFGREIL